MLSGLKQMQSSGKLERTGSPELLVNRESAIHPNSKIPRDVLSIDRDHSEIVKFGPDDHAYLILRKMLLSAFPQQSEPAEPRGRPDRKGYHGFVPRNMADTCAENVLPENWRPQIAEVRSRGGRRDTAMHPYHMEPTGHIQRAIIRWYLVRDYVHSD